MIRIGPTTHSKPQKTPQSDHQRLNGLVCPYPRLLDEWLLSTINQVSWVAIAELDLDLLALFPPPLISERDWHKSYDGFIQDWVDSIRPLSLIPIFRQASEYYPEYGLRLELHVAGYVAP